jgi:hypothetical protein
LNLNLKVWFKERAHFLAVDQLKGGCVMKAIEVFAKARRYFRTITFAVCATVLLAASTQSSIAQRVGFGTWGTAPPLTMRQGMCFQYLVPAGWIANDTTNGVDIISPDHSQYVFVTVLERSLGHQTPEGFVRMIANAVHLQNVQIMWDQPGPRLPFYNNIRTIEFTSVYNGIPMRTKCVCAIQSLFGGYNAFCEGYSAPLNRFNTATPLLDKLVNSVVATNGMAIAGRNTIMPAINHPNTAGDSIMKSWEYKNRVNDRLSQEREEAMLGISRQKDPYTGRIYDMPYNAYDPSRGGYVNPYHRTELLQHALPGE